MTKNIDRAIRKSIKHIKNGKYEEKLVSSIEKILEGKNYTISSRVKALNSAIEKFNRKKYYTTEQLDDLLGIMLVIENEEQLYQIVKNIKDNFNIVHEDDYIKNPKPYGYKSYHLVIIFQDIKAEIQLKTKDQKLASDMTHDIYKSEDRCKFVTLKNLFTQVL